jgi:hypothetical protein
VPKQQNMIKNKRSLVEEITEGIKELETMRNNKPYIWMDDLGTWFTDEDYQNLDSELKEGMFPLYTHPAKTLTDEEIWELADMVLENSDVIGFARAILRKAQEK